MISIRAILVSFLILCSTSGLASEILKDGWTVEFEKQRIVSSPLEFKWDRIPEITSHHPTVVYTKHFNWSPSISENRDVYIVIPPSWVGYQVFLNDVLVADLFGENTDIKPHIYASFYDKLPKNILKTENFLKIAASGSKILGGFRGNAVIVTNELTYIKKERLKNFFKNDIYLIFAALSLVLGLIFITITLFFRVFGIHYGFIGLGSLFIVPHHLLASNFFLLIFHSQEALFKFHQFSQTIAWPCFAAYFLSHLDWFRSVLQQLKRKKLFWISLATMYLFVAILAIYCPLYFFTAYINPAFYLSIAIATPVTIYLNRHNPIIFCIELTGYVICLATVVSEFTSSSYYYFGYGSTLFSISGFYFLFQDFVDLKKDLEKKVKEQTQQLREKAQTLENTLQALKQTQAELLLQSEKMASLGTLSAGIAHEINNAMNKISGGMRTIERFLVKSPESPPEVATLEVFGIMNRGVDLVIEIVENLRSYSRPEKGELSAINIYSVVQTVCAILKSKIGKTVKLNINVPEGVLVIGSHSGLVQLLSNLMTNSIDSLPDGKGTIEISVSTTSDHWKLVVADTGVGIPEEVQSKVFDPFFTTKEVGKGTGLGLFVVKKEVERHKGKLSFESKIGIGTRFTIEFPNSKESS